MSLPESPLNRRRFLTTAALAAGAAACPAPSSPPGPPRPYRPRSPCPTVASGTTPPPLPGPTGS
ncbi:twin-arginine translocation signal domain-containing protein [Streptomyces sp. NPDC057280]|uniref:twin-arginine translocation signal domain-containing protein n=1 Tax=Streptomyces sp. NPDC057280 TaxID=3346081 RepID=UPI00362B49E7